MPLFSYREKCCGTCRYWQGAREDVYEVDGYVFDLRAVEGYVFCFKDMPAATRPCRKSVANAGKRWSASRGSSGTPWSTWRSSEKTAD